MLTAAHPELWRRPCQNLAAARNSRAPGVTLPWSAFPIICVSASRVPPLLCFIPMVLADGTLSQLLNLSKPIKDGAEAQSSGTVMGLPGVHSQQESRFLQTS